MSLQDNQNNEVKVHQYTPPKYWQSFQELQGDASFLQEKQGEFLSTPLKEEESSDGFERREFLKLMAASTALASMTACVRRPVQKIVPFVNAREEVIPGVANYYASTYLEEGMPQGILVKTRENRPIKIEGNPDHVLGQGGTTARAQASVLNLYDPDRAKAPGSIKRGEGGLTQMAWADLDKAVVEKLKSAKRVRFLTGNITGVGSQTVIRDFLGQFADGKQVVFEALGPNSLAAGQLQAYGKAQVPRYQFDKADVVVSFGTDFLGSGVDQATHTRDFVKLRKLNKQSKKMSKLFVFESRMSLTGTNADVR